jgi:hypothetical protein
MIQTARRLPLGGSGPFCRRCSCTASSGCHRGALGRTRATPDLVTTTSIITGPPIGPREGDAEVGDVRLVVLLHGFPEFCYCWQQQIEPLVEAGFRVVAPDLRRSGLVVGAGRLRRLHRRQAGRGRRRSHPPARCRVRDGRRPRLGRTAAWTLVANHPEVVDCLVILQIPKLPQRHAHRWRRVCKRFLRDAGGGATATSDPSSPSRATRTCTASTASSACPPPPTGSTTTRPTASTSCSSTSHHRPIAAARG